MPHAASFGGTRAVSLARAFKKKRSKPGQKPCPGGAGSAHPSFQGGQAGCRAVLHSCVRGSGARAPRGVSRRATHQAGREGRHCSRVVFPGLVVHIRLDPLGRSDVKFTFFCPAFCNAMRGGTQLFGGARDCRGVMWFSGVLKKCRSAFRYGFSEAGHIPNEI